MHRLSRVLVDSSGERRLVEPGRVHHGAAAAGDAARRRHVDVATGDTGVVPAGRALLPAGAARRRSRRQQTRAPPRRAGPGEQTKLVPVNMRLQGRISGVSELLAIFCLRHTCCCPTSRCSATTRRRMSWSCAWSRSAISPSVQTSRIGSALRRRRDETTTWPPPKHRLVVVSCTHHTTCEKQDSEFQS